MAKYLRVFLFLTVASFQTFLQSRVGAFLFLAGKILRFVFFLGFLVLLVSKTRILAGYDLWQVLLFYLTFNLIDATTQMLFREVYQFRQKIISGNFDLILVKPVNSLFRTLFGWTDLLDFVTLLPFVVFIGLVLSKIPQISIWNGFSYILLVINALWIAASFHIMVLSLAILTTEIDHAIMIYRDFTGMGKVPMDIYQEPLRSLLTFAIPVGIMMTFPVKALLGILSIFSIAMAIGVNLVLFIFSLFLWRYALKQYTSASS